MKEALNTIDEVGRENRSAFFQMPHLRWPYAFINVAGAQECGRGVVKHVLCHF